MANQGVDKERRRLLTTATTAIGAVGASVASVPFAKAMLPSAKALAAGADVEVDISDMRPGELRVVEWRRSPVWVLRRTPEMLKAIEETENRLKDPNSEAESQQPDYAQNRYRSRNPEYLVVMGVCTHLGCSPTYTPEHGVEEIGSWWKGGFFCPCHQSEYDLSGRVFEGRSPAPLNLPVPPHRFATDSTLVVGDQT